MIDIVTLATPSHCFKEIHVYQEYVPNAIRGMARDSETDHGWMEALVHNKAKTDAGFHFFSVGQFLHVMQVLILTTPEDFIIR